MRLGTQLPCLCFLLRAQRAISLSLRESKPASQQVSFTEHVAIATGSGLCWTDFVKQKTQRSPPLRFNTFRVFTCPVFCPLWRACAVVLEVFVCCSALSWILSSSSCGGTAELMGHSGEQAVSASLAVIFLRCYLGHYWSVSFPEVFILT